MRDSWRLRRASKFAIRDKRYFGRRRRLTHVYYGDYPAIPFLWAAAAPPTEEVLTEIKSFILLSVSPGPDGKQCPPDPRIPAVPLSWPMVKAGTFAGVTPRSLGIVQENVANGPAAPDFPAHSFFDIFVNVNLPPLPGTVSGGAFPVTGAVLYNDSLVPCPS